MSHENLNRTVIFTMREPSIPNCERSRNRLGLLVPVECAGREAVAVTDQIRAVAKERLAERLGTISPEHLRAVEEGVRRILEL